MLSALLYGLCRKTLAQRAFSTAKKSAPAWPFNSQHLVKGDCPGDRADASRGRHEPPFAAALTQCPAAYHCWRGYRKDNNARAASVRKDGGRCGRLWALLESCSRSCGACIMGVYLTLACVLVCYCHLETPSDIDPGKQKNGNPVWGPHTHGPGSSWKRRHGETEHQAK